MTLHRTMQTTEKDWDSFDATIYNDGSTTHGNANGSSGIIATTGPQVTLESTVSALSRSSNGTCPSEPKSKQCGQPSNWYRRMSPSIRCASLQIACQLSNEYKIFIHPSNLPTMTKTRFVMLWPRLLRQGALAILVSTVMS